MDHKFWIIYIFYAPIKYENISSNYNSDVLLNSFHSSWNLEIYFDNDKKYLRKD